MTMHVSGSPASGFMPTHSVPKGGTPAWTTPDPAAPPATHLNARVELQVIETTGAWARVRASNGWEGWVDGRVLIPTAARQAADQGASASWTPTHAVPAAGAAAWVNPDPSVQPVARLEPHVQLQLIENQGAWARVIGANGWTGWVDGRVLVPVAARTSPLALALPAVGAGIAVASGFMPWVSVGGLGVSAWDVPLVTLLTRRLAGGLDTAVPLFVTLIAVIPLVRGHAFNLVATGLLASIPLSLAIFGYGFAHSFPGGGIGPGVFVAGLGALVLLVGAALSARRQGSAGARRS